MSHRVMAAHFVGYKVAAGEKLDIVQAVSIQGMRRPHITNIALGPDPKSGRHTVYVEGDGAKGKIVVGTLEKGRCEQFTVDLPVDVQYSHSGKSDVYLSGFTTTSGQEGSDEEEDDEFDEEADDFDDEDDVDAPQAVPLPQLMPSRVSSQKSC